MSGWEWRCLFETAEPQSATAGSGEGDSEIAALMTGLDFPVQLQEVLISSVVLVFSALSHLE